MDAHATPSGASAVGAPTPPAEPPAGTRHRPRAPGYRSARTAWVLTALVGVLGHAVNYALRSGTGAPGELGAAVASAATVSAMLGLLVASALALVWLVLAVALGRGWSPARWPLLLSGLVGIALDTQFLAGGWLVLSTAVIQIAGVLCAVAVMFGRGVHRR